MQTFNIKEYIQFNGQGRAVCPACQQIKGEGYRKTNLSLLESGAYKCHRGCTPNEIRAALGTQPGNKNPHMPITATLTLKSTSKAVTITPQKKMDAHNKLLSQPDGPAMQWLKARGITNDICKWYHIGMAKAKVGKRLVWAIAIPIPANADNTAYYQKKRVLPWLSDDELRQQLGDDYNNYKPWSQWGIPALTWLTHNPQRASATWLCEGEWDAMLLGWQCFQQDLPIAVASFTCGCNTIPPLSEMEKLPDPVYVFYDRDQPGSDGAKKLCEKMGDRFRQALVPQPNNCEVKSWDVSNALQHGYSLAEFSKAAETAESLWDKTIDITAIATTRKGRLLGIMRNSYADRLRFNAMSKQVELDQQPLDPDFVYISLLEQGLDVGAKEFAIDVFLYLAKKKPFNPVVTFLESVAKEHGPNDELLNTAANRYLGTDDPLHATFLRKTLIAAIARAMKPGCKVDTALIFTGGQGLGKSSFWSILAGEFFCDSLSGQTSDTDEKIKLYSAWIHEWAELEQVFKRKETSQVKAFLSATHDTFRMPWGRSAEKHARHSVIVGTTNEDDFLGDSTGSRRYWVLQLRHKVCLELLERDRDALWAAAVHAYREGASWVLSQTEAQASEAINRRFQREDPWFSAIEEYAANRESIKVSQLLDEAIKLELSRQDRAAQMRVADCLKSLGWQRRHTKAGKIWEKGSQVVTQPLEPNNSNDSKTDYLILGGSQEVVSSQNQEPMTTPNDYLDRLTTSKNEVVSPETPDTTGFEAPDDYLTTKNAPHCSPVLEIGAYVEILTGGYKGRRATVTGFEEGKVLVRCPRWVFDRSYPSTELKLWTKN